MRYSDKESMQHQFQRESVYGIFVRTYLLNSFNSFTKERAKIFTKCVKLKMPDLVHFLVNRRYYMAARGYEFYLRVLKVSLTGERNERVRYPFSTRR